MTTEGFHRPARGGGDAYSQSSTRDLDNAAPS